MKGAYLLTILVFFASCKKDEGSTNVLQPSNGVIFPLKSGNQWIMKISFIDSTTWAPVFDTIKVTKDTLISNERWFYVSTASEFLTGGHLFPYETYLTNRSDGLWWLLGATPNLFLKYPATAGERYRFDVDTMLVVSTNTSVSIPAGSYACYEYRSLLIQASCFLSPNIGIVKFSDYQRSFGGGPTPFYRVREELVSAILN